MIIGLYPNCEVLRLLATILPSNLSSEDDGLRRRIH